MELHKPLPKRQICPAILGLAITKRITSARLPDDLMNLVSPFFPQSINRKRIETVSREIKSGIPFQTALSHISYDFPFLPTTLSSIARNDIPEPEIVACLVLFSYLSWRTEFTDDRDPRHVLLLLQCLLKLLGPTFSEQIRNISYSVFYELFRFSIHFDLVAQAFPIFSAAFDRIKPSLSAHLCKLLPELFARTKNDDMLNLLSDIIGKIGKNFPRTILESIVDQIPATFHEPTLMFCNAVANVFGAGPISPFLGSLSAALLKARSIVASQGGLVLPAKFGRDIELKPIGFQLHFSNVPEFPELLSTDELIEPASSAHIETILKIFGHNTYIIQYLLELSGAQTVDYDSLSIFLVFMKRLQAIARIEPPFEIVTGTLLFDPAIVFSDPPGNWPLINTLRALAIDVVAECGVLFTQRVVLELVAKPLLFAEVVWRLFPLLADREIQENETEMFSKLLTDPILYYLSFSEPPAAVSASFTLLNAILSRSDSLERLMQCSHFVESFCGLLVVSGVRTFVMKFLRRYFERPSSEISPCVPRKVVSAVVSLWDVDLLQEVVGLFDGALGADCEYGQLFEALVGPAMTHMGGLAVGEDFLRNWMDFLVRTGKFHQPTKNEVGAFAQLLHRFGTTEWLYAKVVEWAAGRHMQDIDEAFELEVPRALIVLFDVFPQGRSFEFVTKLCNFSESNCTNI
jgi:hypothetical protein